MSFLNTSRSVRVGASVLALSAAICGASPLYAQAAPEAKPEDPPAQEILDEPQTEAEAAQDAPVIVLDAGLSLQGGFSDNIFATGNDKVNDVVGILRPRISASVRGDNYRIALTGRGEIARYDANTAEDYDDWTIGLNSRAQVSDRVTLVGGGQYRWDHENRTSPDDVNGFRPTEYQSAYGFAGLLYNADSISFRLAGTIEDLDFFDVTGSLGQVNNDDRDRTRYEIGARVGTAISSDTQVFVQGAYDERSYDQLIDDFGFARDSDGFAIAAGLQHRFNNRLSGEVFAGIMKQNYTDPLLEDVSTIDFGAVLDWADPSGILASFSLDRSIAETTLPGASSYVLTRGRLSVRALDAPKVTAGFSVVGANLDYRGVARSEFATSAGVWARYWVSDRVHVGAEYDFGQRSSDRAGFDYDENRLMLRVGAQVRKRRARAPVAQDAFSPRQNAVDGAYGVFMVSHGTLITGLDGPRGNGGSNTADFGNDGAGIVGALGYGFTNGPIYLGLDLQAQLKGPKWDHIAPRTFSVEMRDALSAGVRVGYVAKTSDLLFTRFGVTSSKLRTEYDHTASTVDISQRETGLSIGLGAEAGFGRGGFVRAEYSLTSYPDYDVPTGRGQSDNFAGTAGRFLTGIGFRFGKQNEPESATDPHSFAGIFAGLQLGHGALITGNTGFRSGGTPIDIERASDGPVLGVMAGFGVMLDKVYAGLEADADISRMEWNIERDPTGRIYSNEHDYSFGGSARLGYQISKSAMVYGRVGAARTRFDTKYARGATQVRERNWQTGLRFGGGLELGLNSFTRLRLDYTHTDYGKFDVEVDTTVDGFDNSENLFRIGVSFRL